MLAAAGAPAQRGSGLLPGGRRGCMGAGEPSDGGERVCGAPGLLQEQHLAAAFPDGGEPPVPDAVSRERAAEAPGAVAATDATRGGRRVGL